MSSSKYDPGGPDNSLLHSAKDGEKPKEVVLSLRPANLVDKQSSGKRSYSPIAYDNEIKKHRRLDSTPEATVAKTPKVIPNAATSKGFHKFSVIPKHSDVTTSGIFSKKPRVLYTSEQLDWLTRYYFTMPDHTAKSWDKASIDFESAWGQLHAGKVLRAKSLKLGLGSVLAGSSESLATVEMKVDELSGTEASTKSPKPGTPVAKKDIETDPVTPPSSPLGTHNRELWLKDNMHKFQRNRSEVDWVSLSNLFNDIFDMKKSTTAMEVMWERAINKNCGLTRSA